MDLMRGQVSPVRISPDPGARGQRGLIIFIMNHFLSRKCLMGFSSTRNFNHPFIQSFPLVWGRREGHLSESYQIPVLEDVEHLQVAPSLSPLQIRDILPEPIHSRESHQPLWVQLPSVPIFSKCWDHQEQVITLEKYNSSTIYCMDDSLCIDSL